MCLMKFKANETLKSNETLKEGERKRYTKDTQKIHKVGKNPIFSVKRIMYYDGCTDRNKCQGLGSV